MKGDRVRFNVGGRIFETTVTTLAAAGPDSFFGSLVSDNWNTKTNDEAPDDNDDEVFIDKNPDCFAIILDLLRTGELSIPPHVGKDALIREAQFYGVVELVRAASWGSPLNVDLALPSLSVQCRAKPSAAKMIFGSPNGGFCVANGTSVHVYDWMLHERPPIHTPPGQMNDALWVGTNNIAIATPNTVGMFDAVTGKLEYKFTDQSGDHVKGATSMCLTDSNIFCLCKSSTENRAIGMLDLESGKLIDSRSLCLPIYLSDISYNTRLKSWRPINLQKVDGSGNCLLATHVFCPYGSPGKHSFEAQIIDTRDSHSVYSRSWSSGNYNDLNNPRKMIRATTVMEDRNSICVINSAGEIGFLDLRFTGDVQWTGSSKEGGCSLSDRIKLAYQSDRIFLLSGKSLVVYTVPDLVMTSEFPRNGIVNSRFDDFSISGDRLFTLHSGTSLVDVWETPRPSCLTIL